MKYLLIVDDEPMVRTAIGRILGSLKGKTVDDGKGGKTLEGKLVEGIDFAEDGQEAYEMIQANPDKYAVIITDDRMPKMTGTQLLENISHLDVGKVMITGTMGQVEKTYPNITYMSKPFNTREVEAVVLREVEKRK